MLFSDLVDGIVNLVIFIHSYGRAENSNFDVALHYFSSVRIERSR